MGALPKHPSERVALALRKPWPIPLYGTAETKHAPAEAAGEPRRAGRGEQRGGGGGLAALLGEDADLDMLVDEEATR